MEVSSSSARNRELTDWREKIKRGNTILLGDQRIESQNNELNDIMIKDGEAAIMWFKSILEG